MSEHKAVVSWECAKPDFSYETYNREHRWTFSGGAVVAASAAPEYKGDPAFVNPEEALVAAISSCHMLTLLAIAARKRLVIKKYRDEAVGILEKGADGKLAITRATLRPRVEFGEKKPTAEEFVKMHHTAHEACFIASSVKTSISVEPEMVE